MRPRFRMESSDLSCFCLLILEKVREVLKNKRFVRIREIWVIRKVVNSIHLILPSISMQSEKREWLWVWALGEE